MAIAALVLWMCTVAIGVYLLATALSRAAAVAPEEPARTPSGQPVAIGRDQDVTASPALARSAPRGRDPFDPPSLQRSKSEPLPGMRALAEFAHPALAITGLAFWLGYVVSRDRLFAAIGLGILLGAICAGLTWAAVNARAARRAAAADPGTEDPGAQPPPFSPRLLILHAAGAALTLLITALIAARA